MKRIITFGLLALLTISVLAGCGGGGSSDSGGGSSSRTSNSPFAGSYSGTFNDAGNAESGTVTVTVATDGKVTGSVTNTTEGKTGSVSGSVSDSGSLNITISYSDETITDRGTVAFASNGHLTGNVTEYAGSTQVGTATLDLVKS